MADLTRRQIAMMADEAGITDHAAAVRLVRRAFEVFLSASAALAAEGPIDDLIPSKYRGWEITVYRDGAQAGYRAALADGFHAGYRAALAADGPAVPEGREPASVVGEPSDEELAQAAKAAIHDYKYPIELGYFLDSDSSEYEPFLLALRAVIAADRARWGHQPAPPAEGEVGELVARLRHASDGASAMGWEQDSWLLARAADLLAKRHPKPVPVAERPWERRGWCDDQGRCWFCNSYSMDRWSYSLPPIPGQYWGQISTMTHSLPHWAIPRPRPLPQQKTTNG